MGVLLVTDDRFVHHETGRHHPERPARLGAVLEGVRRGGLADALEVVTPRPVSAQELVTIHTADLVGSVEEAVALGGGHLDADTVVSPGSWAAARLAAGAGLSAVEHLDAGGADAAFCAVRPPGHHATRGRAMGFCLLNNVAVTARALADRGERVLIADFDAHHGNGTQDVVGDDPRILFVSWHQWPLYPGTGRMDEIGDGAGRGTTINVPLPAGATIEHLRRSLDEVVAPAAAGFGPTWLLISAGFDGHRADPLTSLGLTSTDFGDLTRDLMALVPRRHVVVFLEGGYDLAALADSAQATVGALAGEDVRPEPASGGGPGAEAVDRLVEFHHRFGVLAQG